MLSSRIGSTNSTEELIAQMNSVINEIVVELNQNTAKLTERDKRITDLEQKIKVLTVDNKELKKNTGDIFRTFSAKTLKLGAMADADASNNSLFANTDIVKYKDTTGTVKTFGDVTSAQLALKANIASPIFTGSVTSPKYVSGSLSYVPSNSVAEYGDSLNSYYQMVIQNKSNGVSASADVVVNNDVSTDSTYYGDFGINSSTFTGAGAFQVPSAVYLYAHSAPLVIGTFTNNEIRFVTNNSATDSSKILGTGEWGIGATPTIGATLTLPTSTATKASLNIGAFGVTKSTPVDGDIWKGAADNLLVRMSTNTRTVAFLEKSQTFAGTQTFGTLTSTGVVTGRSFYVTQQSNTPTGTTYTWTLTSGNQLSLTLTSSTGNVTVTTSAPTLGVESTLYVQGHGTLSRDVTITQSGVTFRMTGKTAGATITLDTIPALNRACYTMFWRSTTECIITREYLGA